MPAASRLAAAVKAVFKAIFSRRISRLLQALALDALCQGRILRDREDRLLWIMHFLIFAGCTLLLLMHALDNHITARVFENYQPTLEPFLLLRNLFGLLVLAGLALAVIRRTITRRGRLKSTAVDYGIIVLLGVIVVSGFLLEAVKIGSYSAFRDMVEAYADASEPGDTAALEAYWVTHYGVVPPQAAEAPPAQVLARGKALHEMSCAACHSPPSGAFVSFVLAEALRPVASGLDRAGAVGFLWSVHFLACFIGVAYLPFSKMFHAIATPVSLAVAAAAGDGPQEGPNAATRQVIEVEGCRHGGTCHAGCPVRRERERRIQARRSFEPTLSFLEGKTGAELGTRAYES